MTLLLRALALLARRPGLAARPVRRRRAGWSRPCWATRRCERSRDAHRRIGGRPTGSAGEPARLRVGARAIPGGGGRAPARSRFRCRASGWSARRGPRCEGRGVTLRPRVAALPFSTGTPAGRAHGSAGGRRPGRGGGLRRARGGAREGAFVLVETEELQRPRRTLPRVHRGGGTSSGARIAAGAAGLVYMSSRPNEHCSPATTRRSGWANRHPMMMMERDAAARALRLLRAGTPLTLTAVLDIQSGPAYTTYNVIGEIRGEHAGRTRSCSSGRTWTPGISAPARWTTAPTSAMVHRHRAADPAAGHPARADDPVRAVERRGAGPQRLVRLHAERTRPSWTST